MAKKQETKKEMEVVNEFKEVETIQVVEQPKTETMVMETPKPKKDTWEIKDRMYYLKGNKKPLSRMIKSAGLYWFDKEQQYEREIKYCENQTTSFVDEMKGDQRLSHIIFRSGNLYVEKEKVILQKFLSLYHPDRDVMFYEDKPVARAESHLRVEIGSEVSKMSSKELKRDLLLFAKKSPKLFLELVKDENIGLRNMAIKACEAYIVELSQDQRTFSWKSTGRKLMTVPFDEHPYSALAAWFKTDEGIEIYSQIEKRLK